MRAFRALLLIILTVIVAYTSVVMSNHGLGLISIFFGDVAAMGWPGQFNLDFMCLLMLSGLWVAWRHRFSAGGILLGLAAFLGGSLFLSVYLLAVTTQANGDMNQVLLGKPRVAGRAS